MILKENYKLNNGVEIPKLGLGTWEIADNKVADAVKKAVKLGYRHIDTAQGYENENGVGIGIKTCGVERENLFITTKIQADFKTYEEARRSIIDSLKRLELEYIDLMIIHAPQPWTKFREENHYFKKYRCLESTGRVL